MTENTAHSSISVGPKRIAKRVFSDKLYDGLARSAHRFPDKPALIFYGARLSFGALHDQVNSLAGYLQNHCQVTPGTRVLLQLQSSPQFVIAYYAVLRAQGVVVPINPMNKTEEVRHVADDCDAKTIILEQSTLDQVAPLLDDGTLKTGVVATYSDALSIDKENPVPDFLNAPRKSLERQDCIEWAYVLEKGLLPNFYAAHPDDLAVLPYTSGSTGLPKGCRHTHATTIQAMESVAGWFEHDSEDVFLAVAPFFHVTGMQTSMNVPIGLGSTTVILPRWDTRVVANLIQKHKISVWPAIPTMAVDLLALPDIDNFDLSSIKSMFGGGVAMPEAVAARLHKQYGISFLEGFGMTEAMAPITGNPIENPKRSSAGLPVHETQLRILALDGPETLKLGEVGEIAVSAPQLFKGYWGNAGADEEFFYIDGEKFFRTGDLGRLNEDGFLFVVDRLKRMINTAGYKVWPAEVEAILFSHPGIQEVCVIAAPSDRSGEIVKALVVPRPDAKSPSLATDIVAWARENMSAYKVPRIVEIVDTLPRSASGKVDWRQIQEQELSSVSDHHTLSPK
ncbi:AMP-binding protein [Tropicibacter sp. Alg240-R139]|uniref:AMP-binding protein n=1 Tax=Tropicibacter sp. Alg240-R139 TaxID=2305991 RepID=UPI0013DE8843|nr:AMP-binding protein [Tropicibacter sp. Alg240-R139]